MEKDVCVLFVNTGILLTLNSERKHFSFGLIRDEKWLFDHACWIFSFLDVCGNLCSVGLCRCGL